MDSLSIEDILNLENQKQPLRDLTGVEYLNGGGLLVTGRWGGGLLILITSIIRSWLKFAITNSSFSLQSQIHACAAEQYPAMPKQSL